MRLYHFTTRRHLASILREGELRLTESNASATEAHAAHPCVWLTESPLARDTAAVLLASAWDKTAVRITVEVPREETLTWRMFCSRMKVDPAWRRALEIGNWRAWRMIFRPVRREEWVAVEARGEDGEYRPVEEE